MYSGFLSCDDHQTTVFSFSPRTYVEFCILVCSAPKKCFSMSFEASLCIVQFFLSKLESSFKTWPMRMKMLLLELKFADRKEGEKDLAAKTTHWWKSVSQSWALGREEWRQKIKIKAGGGGWVESPEGGDARCTLHTSSNSIRHKSEWPLCQQGFFGDRCVFKI